MSKIFSQIDTDDSGELTAAELKRALACLGLKKVDADECLAGFDKDSDGKISLDEWKAGLKKETLQLSAPPHRPLAQATSQHIRLSACLRVQ